MTRENDSWKFSDEAIDRLVDGELGEPERTALLAALDSDPGGWRRCALAFLESQVWSRELTRPDCGAVAAKTSTDSNSRSTPKQAVRVSLRRSALLALAAALSLLAAFSLGWGAGVWMDAGGFDNRPPHAVAESSPGAGNLSSVAGDKQLENRDDLRPTDGAPPDRLAYAPPAYLTMALGSGEDAEIIDVPIYDLQQVGADWLTRQEPPIPQELLQRLKRSGRELRRQRGLVPVSLDEGVDVVLPVERIQIVPASNRLYQ